MGLDDEGLKLLGLTKAQESYFFLSVQYVNVATMEVETRVLFFDAHATKHPQK